jgi:hypothetical protein
MSLKSGYMGLCILDGLKIRVNDFSVNVKQEVEFYDHIIGLRDSLPSGLNTKGDTGRLNVQKTFWRPGVKICTGNISFPATTKNLQKTFDLVKTGDDFELIFTYSCNDVRRTFKFCKISSFNFTVTAGDHAVIQLSIMARDMTEGTGSSRLTSPEKLLTWDQIGITSISSHKIQMFSFVVNNPCIPIYTAGTNSSNDLFPKKIRVGMQSVTGSIVYYIKGISYTDLDKDTGINTINIKISDKCSVTFNESLCVVYKPIERGSNIGALLHTLPFVGIGKALGA